MLMRPLLKTIFRRLNSMLKPQSASIMGEARQEEREGGGGGGTSLWLSHGNVKAESLSNTLTCTITCIHSVHTEVHPSEYHPREYCSADTI